MLAWHDYLQIATLILFFLLTTGRAIHLRVTQGINPFTIGKGKKGFHKVVEICFVLGIALWVIAVLSLTLHFQLGPPLAFLNKELLDWQFVKFIGAAMLICSLAMFSLALAAFGNSWRVGIDERTPGRLVSRGIFDLTRNPIFLALIVYAGGTFLISGRLILLVFWILIVMGVHLQIIREEEFLLSRYGRAYEEYRARTGRYFSFRRSSPA